MARYRGGRLKVIRRLGTPLPGLTAKVPRREAAPTGAARGRGARTKKISDFGLQLLEKQKVRFHYGVSETQLRRYFQAAAAKPGVTGELLLASLERRLDNTVFRLSFAPTMPAARQLVSHGHVAVDGRRVTIPSFSVHPGQTVSLRPDGREMAVVRQSIEGRRSRRVPSHLEVAPDDPFTARLVSEPQREDVPIVVDDAAVVAYYSRRG